MNVSRAPEPCRLMQMPSKTCTRWRLPSITLKCTRSVSPALNWGTRRSWRRSMLSMTVLMHKGSAVGRRRMIGGRNRMRRTRRLTSAGPTLRRRQPRRLESAPPKAGSSGEDSAPAESCFASKRQRSEIRFGGQYVANTLPMRLPRGTEPHSRESHDWERLSPIMK